MKSDEYTAFDAMGLADLVAFWISRLRSIQVV